MTFQFLLSLLANSSITFVKVSFSFTPQPNVTELPRKMIFLSASFHFFKLKLVPLNPYELIIF